MLGAITFIWNRDNMSLMAKPHARCFYFNLDSWTEYRFREAIHIDGLDIEIENSPLRKLKSKPLLVNSSYSFLRVFINRYLTWTHWGVQSDQNVLILSRASRGRTTPNEKTQDLGTRIIRQGVTVGFACVSLRERSLNAWWRDKCDDTFGGN